MLKKTAWKAAEEEGREAQLRVRLTKRARRLGMEDMPPLDTAKLLEPGPLAAWMYNPRLLPKQPPPRRPQQDEDSHAAS